MIKIQKITNPEAELNMFDMLNKYSIPGESNEQFENQEIFK
jgi:hypothetical protein